VRYWLTQAVEQKVGVSIYRYVSRRQKRSTAGGFVLMKVERGVIIERPVDKVFAFIANPDNNPKWQPEVVEHQKLTEGPMGVGTRLRHVSKFMGRCISVVGIVDEFELGRMIAFRVESGTLPYTIRYSVASQGRGTTRFTYSSLAHIQGLLKLLQPLMIIGARRVIDRDLNRLKVVLEDDRALA